MKFIARERRQMSRCKFHRLSRLKKLITDELMLIKFWILEWKLGNGGIIIIILNRART